MRPFSTEGAFDDRVTSGDGELRRRAVRGAGATLFLGAVALAIQVIATMVLTRLLTPTDFGLIAMVTTFSLLLVNFGYNGLTEAIVQREEMNHALASNLFWINIGFGVLLTIVFAACGSLLARFYHSPQVQWVAIGISLTIFTTSLSTVHLALLKRAMHFSWVSTNDICARVVSVALSILLGFMGWGYWALVAGAVVLPVSVCIGAMFMCRWRPGIPRQVAGTGTTLRFALHTYGNFGVNYLSRNTDNLLVGWRFDAASLGFYKKAYDLFALSAGQLTSSISVVVVTALSRVRKDPPLFRRSLLDALAVMAFVGMGLGAGLTLVGKDLILILLGPKWGPSGRIFTFFGPGVGVMIIYGTHGWIHLSLGRADRWFRWAVVEFVATFLLFVAGLHWGPVGIAVAWSLSFWALTIPAIWYAGKPINLDITAVLSVMWRYAAAFLVTVSVTYLVMHQVPGLAGAPGALNALIRIAVVSIFVTVLYVGTVVLMHGGFEPVYNIVGLARELKRSGKPNNDSSHKYPHNGESTDDSDENEMTTNNLPLVSILIPAYNAEEWIEDTIRSALAQTWPRTEIIVIDDGSKDSTAAIVRQFEPQGVRVYTQQNQGASAARNNAFSQCHGDYIQWLDADDLLSPDKIARQMELVMEGLAPRTLLSGPWGHFMYRPHRARFVQTALWCDLSPEEWLLRKMDYNIYMQTATWLVSREITEAAGPWDTRLLGDDDGEYFCRALLASDGVRFVPDAKVYYRAFHFDSLSYIGRFPKKIKAHWISVQLHIGYLRSFSDNATTRAACVQFLRDSLIYFYPESPEIVQQAEELAVELGEELGTPDLSWKYSWIERAFGWNTTIIVQTSLRKLKWRSVKKLEELMFRLEGQKRALSAN